MAGLFVGVGQLQDSEVGLVSADDLQAHGQAAGVEANLYVGYRATGQGAGNHHLHPAVIGVHGHAFDGGGPRLGFIEGEHLGAGQQQVVVFFEQPGDRPIPVAARH
ncbi:hypothetical protein D3C77_693740 [compost metagenome]